MSSKESWAERVRAWRQSGQSAPAFSVGKGFTSSALRYWASRVESGSGSGARTVSPGARASGPQAVRLARVVDSQGAGGGEVAVVVGNARVVVASGFDPVLLREVVQALGALR